MADLHAFRRDRSMQRIGPVAEPGHRGPDRAESGDGMDRRGAGREQDRPRAPREHVRQHLVHGGDGAVDVEVDPDLDVCGAQLRRGRERERAVARRALEHVARAEALLHRREAGRDRPAVARIGVEGGRDDAAGGELGYERLLLGGVARQERNSVTVPAESLGDCQPHSGAGAEDGDDGHGGLHRTRTSGTTDMRSGTIENRVWPTWTYAPGSTLLRVTRPVSGAYSLVYERSSSAWWTAASYWTIWAAS